VLNHEGTHINKGERIKHGFAHGSLILQMVVFWFATKYGNCNANLFIDRMDDKKIRLKSIALVLYLHYN